MEELTIDEQIRVFMNSDILLAVYGSEMVNALFMLPQSAVVEIYPPFWDDNQYSQYVISLGLAHFSLHTTGPMSKVCQKRPDSFECYTKGIRDRNLTVSVQDAMILWWKARTLVLEHKYSMKSFM